MQQTVQKTGGAGYFLEEVDKIMPKEFSGLRVEQIYQMHSFDTPYIKENYKTALGELSGAYQPAADKNRGALWARHTKNA